MISPWLPAGPAVGTMVIEAPVPPVGMVWAVKLWMVNCSPPTLISRMNGEAFWTWTWVAGDPHWAVGSGKVRRVLRDGVWEAPVVLNSSRSRREARPPG